MTINNKKILIQGGHICTASDDYLADILIVGTKIMAIGLNLNKITSADETIDASGLYVFPGAIDVHTHLELPFMGTYSSDNFETGTYAGLHGGTTSIIDYAIQSKGDSLNNSLNQWHEKAQGQAVSDYGFHVAITDYNEKISDELPKIINSGVTSFKAFMAYKGSLMIDDKNLLNIMEDMNRCGGLLAIHAENGDIIARKTETFQKEKKLTPYFHSLAHPIEAEVEAAGRVTDLAHICNNVVYIVHTSSGEVLRRIQLGLLRNQTTLVETCPQYLLLDESVYKKENFEAAKYVMSPPIRHKREQEALWHGLDNGQIQVIGTDHCPFNFIGQKDMGFDDFSKIPNGAAGIEHRLELIFSEGVLKKRLSLNRLVQVCASNPAAIFGMTNKGNLSVGKDADIVLFDPSEKHVISAKTHHHNVDHSIYEGLAVTGKVKTVLSRGMVVIRDGQSDQIEKGRGEFIARKPYK